MSEAVTASAGVPLVLASASPRRRELLALAGLAPRIVTPDVDESLEHGETPEQYVVRVARRKAEAVEASEGEVVIAADTTVEIDGEVLAKPADAAEASRMLERLSGRPHLVHTGVAVLWHGPAAVVSSVDTTLVTTRVVFDVLSSERIARYVATGEPFGKAGAYAIQGTAAAFVRSVEGSVTNVIGLPLVETLELVATVTGVSPV